MNGGDIFAAYDKPRAYTNGDACVAWLNGFDPRFLSRVLLGLTMVAR